MRAVVAILLLVIGFPAISQKSKQDNESYYIFDRNWKACKMDSAAFLSYVKKLNDSAYQWYNYYFSGPLISVETYKDKTNTVYNGFMAYYDEDGRLDSAGYARNGRRDRSWYFYTDTLSVYLQKDYDNGVLIKTIDVEEQKKEEAEQMESQHGSDVVETEAEFKGGTGAWTKYLQKNIQYPERALNLDKAGKVMMQFVIDTDGSVKDIMIAQSVEFSLDKEAWRLVEQSPIWQPALQNGKYVKAYRRQPVNFALQ